MRLPKQYLSPRSKGSASLPERLSLCPTRTRATSSRALCTALLKNENHTTLNTTFTQGLRSVCAGLHDNFPENIYGDLDYFSSAILKMAQQAENPESHLKETFKLTNELLHLYGRHSAIRFRYAHDFFYGFDWVRWVRKAPDTNRQINPFAPSFLHYLKERGEEVLGLIAKGDAKYPPLPAGESRNTFPFSRDVQSEMLLHQTLAANDLVPIAAWDYNAKPDCNRDYSQLREERARRLRLNQGDG